MLHSDTPVVLHCPALDSYLTNERLIDCLSDVVDVADIEVVVAGSLASAAAREMKGGGGTIPKLTQEEDNPRQVRRL